MLAMTDRRLVFVALTGLLGRNVQSVDIPYSSNAGLNVGKFGAWLLEVSSGAGEYRFSAGPLEGRRRPRLERLECERPLARTAKRGPRAPRCSPRDAFHRRPGPG
jgi:hypothetical protein